MKVTEFIADLSHTDIKAEKNCIIIDNYVMRVDNNHEFTFQLLRTKINATGGAEGLAKNLKSWIANGDKEVTRIGSFALCSHEVMWASRVISHVRTFGRHTFF